MRERANERKKELIHKLKKVFRLELMTCIRLVCLEICRYLHVFALEFAPIFIQSII